MTGDCHVPLCVQVRLAGMFSKSQSCQGKNLKPCSLDGRYEGNRLPEAHRRSCLWDSKQVTGPSRK